MTRQPRRLPAVPAYAPEDATILAWLCDCAETDVHLAARTIGLRFSERYFLRLRDMARVAYHLGTVLERQPTRSAVAPVSGRCALWLRVSEGSDRWCCLWGVEAGLIAVRRIGVYHDGHEKPHVASDLDSWCVPQLINSYRTGGAVARPCSWLIPSARY